MRTGAAGSSAGSAPPRPSDRSRSQSAATRSKRTSARSSPGPHATRFPWSPTAAKPVAPSRSSPSPPSSRSRPPSPSSVSSPAPPVSRSRPPLPRSVSSPPSPASASVPGRAVDGVGALAARETVGPQPALELVHPRVACEHVGEPAAGHVLDPHEDVALGVAARRARGQRDPDRSRRGHVGGGRLGRGAVEPIGARAAHQRRRAPAAVQRLRVHPRQRVGPVTAVERVAHEPVVAGAAVDRHAGRGGRIAGVVAVAELRAVQREAEGRAAHGEGVDARAARRRRGDRHDVAELLAAGSRRDGEAVRLAGRGGVLQVRRRRGAAAARVGRAGVRRRQLLDRRRAGRGGEGEQRGGGEEEPADHGATVTSPVRRDNHPRVYRLGVDTLFEPEPEPDDAAARSRRRSTARSPRACARGRSTTTSARSTCSAPGSALRTAIESGRPHSMVLFGPPGTGKTTLARMTAEHADAAFEELSRGQRRPRPRCAR